MPTEVELFDDLAVVERDAGDALARAARPSLFDRLTWHRLLARHSPPQGKLLVARAADGARRCWLFLSVGSHKAEAYANWYSLRYAAVGETDLLPAIARTLKLARLGEVDLAPIEQPEALEHAFREVGWLVSVGEATVNWRVETAEQDFAAYWARRPGRLRSTAQRKAKAAGLEIAIHRRFDEAAWAEYESVYQASWKPEEGSPAFLRALAEQEGEAGTLRLGIARKDGRPIAAQLWLVEGGVAVIHKLAYVEDARALSPGTVLSREMFRHVLDEDKVNVIDFGTGDDPYKADWMEERRVLWRLRAFNPATPRGLARAARAWASSLVRRLRNR